MKRDLPRSAVWLLLLALLQAQWLGQWHRISHAPHAAHAAAPALVAAVQAEQRSLFGHAAVDEAECRLYDQLGSADALDRTPCVAAAPPAPVAPAAALLASIHGRALWPYQARGPPRV